MKGSNQNTVVSSQNSVVSMGFLLTSDFLEEA
jgi:hypothetical protein